MNRKIKYCVSRYHWEQNTSGKFERTLAESHSGVGVVNNTDMYMIWTGKSGNPYIKIFDNVVPGFSQRVIDPRKYEGIYEYIWQTSDHKDITIKWEISVEYIED